MHFTIYFDSDLYVREQVAILSDWLQQHGDEDHEKYFHIYDGLAYSYNFEKSGCVEISLHTNPTYKESWMDYDIFRDMLEYDDDALNLSQEKSLKNITEILQIFWKANIPTFVQGYDDYELPYKGGVNGPVPWPEIK